MNKKMLIGISFIFMVVIFCIFSLFIYSEQYNEEIDKIEGIVLYKSDSILTIQDKNHIIYTINVNGVEADVGDDILVEYTGILDKNSECQDVSVTNYSILNVLDDKSDIPQKYQDNGIFSDYYLLAYNKLKTLTLDEKIGQLFLVRYSDETAIEDLKKYKFSGFIFFEKDFEDKTKKEVIKMIDNLQNVSKIPLLTAVDEEGGKVVRISSNSLLTDYRFKSSQHLYDEGGFEFISEDTKYKSKLLSSLGLNLNLAPVVDVSTNSSDYIYERSFGKGVALTSEYARTVIEASKDTAVSYTLKHFPGYGNNNDTHLGSSIDTRTYDYIINNDLPPFKAGIEVGAEAVLVSHNIVNSIDPNNPASLSVSIHNLLRNELGFTGIVMTDDLDMTAVSSIPNVSVKAILAGNDLIISTDYENDITDVKAAIEDGTISESTIDKLAFRVLAWKYYKGLMFNGK